MRSVVCLLSVVLVCGCASMQVPEIGVCSYAVGEYQRDGKKGVAAGESSGGETLVKLIAVAADTMLYGMAAKYVSDHWNKGESTEASVEAPTISGNGNIVIQENQGEIRIDQSENH